MKVFLSSTYLDLRDHRSAVVEALERLGQQVERMEIFGARQEEPLSACLSEVEECDFFVGIYAYRYGFIPEGATVSVTEAELRHAVKRNKPVFCFLVEEEHPWAPKLMEKGPGEAKLEALKLDLRRMMVCDRFTNPENLALKVATAVGRYLSRESNRETYSSSKREIFVGIAVAEAVAMLFVDIMRLLYVGFSESAYSKNIARYPEFVDTADQHLGDLRSQLTRFASSFDSGLRERSLHVERRLSWAMTRLKRGPDMAKTWSEYSGSMHEISQQVHEFCVAAAQEYYLEKSATVEAVVDRILSQYGKLSTQVPLDKLFQLRLAIQSTLLEGNQRTGGPPIRTIRDDMDQQLGISYFIVDRRLLQEITKNAQPE